ncbi:MAG: toxin-antitoxin system HicB family antitoxin [Deltaproteobacteria bacterium]|nr:toxin-antitoxin system HicB family antitoxin [Deltaproteobacteria bacterium]
METPSGQMPLRIPVSLHKRLKELAYHEGVSLNQYCLFLLALHAGEGEERYYTHAWIRAEKMASADYRKKKVRRAKNLHDLFRQLNRDLSH